MEDVKDEEEKYRRQGKQKRGSWNEIRRGRQKLGI